MEGKERCLMIECGDGKWRMLVVDIATNLVLRSHVVAEPVEDGWLPEAPDTAELHLAEVGADIPIGHTDQTWNSWDDPL